MSSNPTTAHLLVNAPAAVQRHLLRTRQDDMPAWPDGTPTVEDGLRLLADAADIITQKVLIRQFRNPDLLVALAEDLHDNWDNPKLTNLSRADLIWDLVMTGQLPYEGHRLLNDVEPATHRPALDDLSARIRFRGAPVYGRLTLTQQAALGVNASGRCLWHDLLTRGAGAVIDELDQLHAHPDEVDQELARLLGQEALPTVQTVQQHPEVGTQLVLLLERVLTSEAVTGRQILQAVCTDLVAISDPVDGRHRLIRAALQGDPVERLPAVQHLIRLACERNIPRPCLRTLWDWIPQTEEDPTRRARTFRTLAAMWTARQPLTVDDLTHDQNTLEEVARQLGEQFPQRFIGVTAHAWGQLDKLGPAGALAAVPFTREPATNTFLKVLQDETLEPEERVLTVAAALTPAAGRDSALGALDDAVDTGALLFEVFTKLPAVSGAALKALLTALREADARWRIRPEAVEQCAEGFVTNYLLAPDWADNDQARTGDLHNYLPRTLTEEAERQLVRRLEDHERTPVPPETFKKILPYLDDNYATAYATTRYQHNGDDTYTQHLLNHLYPTGRDHPNRTEDTTIPSLLITTPAGLRHPQVPINLATLNRAAAHGPLARNGPNPLKQFTDELTTHLGDNPSQWELALELLENWDSSFTDLLNTLHATK